MCRNHDPECRHLFLSSLLILTHFGLAIGAADIGRETLGGKYEKQVRANTPLPVLPRYGSLTLFSSVAQTYVDIDIARGVAEVGTRRQNAPLRDAAEVCVSSGATSRCPQVHRSAGSGEQSMDASRPRQYT